MTGERPPRPGETCQCGRPAVVVFVTDDHGDVPWCGIADGGARPERPGAGRADTPIEEETMTSIETAAKIQHPDWCVPEACDVHHDPLWDNGSGELVGFHSTAPVSLDFGEDGGSTEVSVQQFVAGAGSADPPRLVVRAEDWFRPDAAQAAELVRVLSEHIALLDRITGS